MKDAVEAHITAVRAYFEPLLSPAPRLNGASRLYASFEQSAAAYRKTGRRQITGLIERVNELAVAAKLLTDPQLASSEIAYEPQLIPGPMFDFVATTPSGPTLYIEVKTISPQSGIDATSWQTATYRGRPATPSAANGITAAQAAFHRYTHQTETKLAAHSRLEPGDGLLVICGTGLAWPPSALTDFTASNRGPLRFGLLIRPQEAVEPSVWKTAIQ